MFPPAFSSLPGGGGCGQVGRGRRGGQREALSTASRPVRAQRELSTCPQPLAPTVRGRCAKPVLPWSAEFVAEPLVNALARFFLLV